MKRNPAYEGAESKRQSKKERINAINSPRVKKT